MKKLWRDRGDATLVEVRMLWTDRRGVELSQVRSDAISLGEGTWKASGLEAG